MAAILDGYTIGMSWELFSLRWDARSLSGKSGMRCQSNARSRKPSSPWVLILVTRLHIHDVHTSRARSSLGLFVFLNQQNKLNQEIAGIWVYILLLPVYSTFLFSSGFRPIASIPNTLDITGLAQNNAFRPKLHPITYTTLYIPSWLSSTTCDWIIMWTPRM